MTLITNIITEEYIIMAADKQKTLMERVTGRPTGVEYVNKFLSGENYVVGIQGTAATSSYDYFRILEQFVIDNPNVKPDGLPQLLLQTLSSVMDDAEVKELNLTISGNHQGALFSFYLKVPAQEIHNCITEPDYSILFNSSKSGEMISDQAFTYIRNYLRGVYKERIKVPDEIREFAQDKLLELLTHTYVQFNESERYPLIGGEMDYCIVKRNEIINKTN